jgi:hypothetical protein
MAKAKVNMYTEPYPPKSFNAPLDIYRTQKPEQDYVEIAEISCSDSNDDWNLEQIQIKAREIGADAIIIVGDAGSYGVGVPVGNTMVYGGSQGYGITAVAIKYVEE